uniref:Uncharacterized protein n=1 Tax=viral metagenome TaxID=1070528 RepID=A0A6M3L7B6_9ZZZZ
MQKVNNSVKIQNYWCEKCGYRGHVYYAEHADVYTVFLAISADHKTHSQECKEQWYLRVVNIKEEFR